MHLPEKVFIFITIALFHVLCIGDKSERNHRKHVSSLFNTSRVLRHSAKRHMLAHDTDSSADEVTFATLSYSKWLASESLVVSPFASSSKVESNHSTTPGVSTEGSLPDHCHFVGPCNTLSAACICCDFNKSCVYGVDVNVTCRVKDDAKCQGNRSFIRTFNCRYCYQTPSDQHKCQKNTSCHVINAPRQRYIAKCIVKPDVLCLGHRIFAKNILCNWTRGYSWGTALLLSVVFGGFGVDRFYLGMWQEGIGKLFSFGGLGVWTLVDVILIAAGYLGPADGSLYI